MRKRLTSLLIAIIMLLQVIITPQNVLAKGDKTLPQGGYVKVGEINAKSYDAKIMNELNRIAAKNRTQSSGKPGARLFSRGPYFGDNNKPKDADKPKYFGKVSAKLDLVGLDGNAFQWNEIFGVDESGNPNPAQIIFRQMDEESSTDTGLYYMLQITKGGKYTWSDGNGNPTKLPLFSKSLKPYRYEVRIDERVSDKVKLLTEVLLGTEGSSPTFSPENADGEIIANITLGLTYQQIASTKFKSEWHTDLAEADRPDMKANFNFDDEGDGISPVSVELPKNDNETKIIRDWYNEFEENLVLSYYLEKTPDVQIDETDTAGLTFEENNGVKTVTSGDHKFKYDFTYDVIEGGKLTMTEIIPVTFDANGGKFENFTDPDTETKIIKEADYKEDLTEKAEDPKREGKTFKGWSTTANGKTPATDDDFKNITEKKTFYAIWENNDIKAEELTVSESFNNGTEYVNDFIPSLDTLKGQVKIKDANGDPQALTDDDTLQILDDDGNPLEGNALKDTLYKKLREEDATNISRNLTLKAKVNFADGTSQEIDIPIKVIKNIYEGTSTGGKPSYVPADYVKVTVDPTDKATNPQKTYYYVNPAAKVPIPGENPEGKDDNIFTKWLIDGTDNEYKFTDRHQFDGEVTIKAQFDKEQQGKIKIKYVDENGNEISSSYHIDGVDYPKTKEGKLGDYATEEDFPKPGPDFKGYIYSNRDSIKGKKYKDQSDPDKLATVTYSYFKKVTTDTPKNTYVYFPVIFDANEGEFEADPKNQKTVYVYFDGNDATVEKVTFKEVLDEFEKAYSNPTKDGFTFKEWQDKADKGSAVSDDYEIQFQGWDEQTYEPTGDTFYAHYGKASALISYLDLDGKPIADDFKIDGVEYPTEKEGTDGDPIEKTVYTAETAPKFIGYEFNRIELNPANAKYALDNKATIKIYYEKLPDIIPDTTPDDDTDKPYGYVTVKFLPGDKGTLVGTRKFYVNPKAGKTNADLTEPTIKAKTGFTVVDKKWDPDFLAATVIDKDATYTAQYTDGQDIIPVPDPTNPPEKPDGYVTVKFDLDGKGTTSDTKEFYVNPNKEVEITAPTVTGIGNYEQKAGDEAWNPKFATKAKYTEDKTFVAQYTFDKDIVPQKPGEDKPVVPSDYVKVQFKQGDHGTIDQNQTTIYWVNPNVEVDLTSEAPTVKANPEYKHTSWDKALKATFSEDTDITAKYLKKVETTNPNDTENYVKVDFVAETKGKIKDGETKEYWVLKDETVELKTPAVEPNENYAFEKWDPAVATSYNKDTTHKAVFVYTGDNVVPQKPDEEKPDVPEDFVEVVFAQGDHGTIAADATITYWVKPNVEVTVTAPKVEANDGYKHVAWTYGTKEETNLQSVTDTFTEKVTKITAKYLKKVLEEKPTIDTDSYVEVKFNAEANGKLADEKTEKSYWVLKDTPVTLTEPTVTANPGWKFIKYDPAVQASYSQDTEHKAQYKKIIETKNPKDKDYVKVTFDPAAQGTIKTSSAEVWVLKDETIDPKDITPELNVKEKYALEKWDPAVQTSYSTDTKHTAIYKYNGDNVVPQKPGEDKPNVPDNFVKVRFVAGDHGSIANTETYIYWVNPEKEVTLNAPKVSANKDYKHVAWTYGTKEETNLQSVTDKFTEKETTITAKYLKKVLTDNPQDTENYVKVEFVASDHGTIGNTETTTYWVLRNTDVTISGPKVTPNSGYTFKEWSPAVKTNYDVDTTHTAQYKEKDKVLTEDPNDTDYIKVTFNANGGKIGLDETKDLWVLKEIASFADAKAKVATPTKEKATFKEWQDKASEGSVVAEDKILSKANETFYAAWTDKDKIIDVTDPKSDVPDSYVRLTFKAGEGTFGHDGEGQDITEKIIDVLKDTSYTDEDLLAKIKTFEDAAKAKTPTKKFNAWDPAVPKTGLVETATFTAQYVDKDKIIEVEDPNVDPKEGYVRLTFDATTDGKIDTKQTKAIDVLSSLKYSDKDLQAKIASINAVPNDNNKLFDKWNPIVPTDDTSVTTKTYKATYKDKDKDIIPGSGNEKPDGYVTVRFLTNKNGSLAGETTYYVNPKAGKTMAEIAAPTITANDGYKVATPNWKPEFTDDTPITEDKNFVANYDSLGKAEINYISMDTNMGTVSPASEAIYENQDIVGSTATAKEGYKFVKWTDVTGKQVSTDARFLPSKKESATYIAVFEKEDTTADKVKKLFDLEGVDLAAFVGDELTNDFWKDGVKSTEKTTSPFTEEEKTAIREALKNATVSDASERNTDQEVLSPSKGTLEIKFADGSVLTVLQKLYVYNNGSDKTEDKPVPKDSIEVTYKAGDGVENFADKTVLVKKGTKESELPGKPDAQAKEGYKDLKWTANPAIDEANGIQEDTSLTASAVVDNDYAKTSFTVKKVWEDDVTPVPIMNFTLYRKVEDGQEEVVPGADVKEITKTTTEATWKELPKTDSEGKTYEYSVKETFKDENSDVKNANWILGDMATEAGKNTITNKLKTVPGEDENPDEKQHRMGKLTITKKIESKPVAMMSRSSTLAAPLEFTFKVTDPYGKEETFTLKAGESKELTKLFYGDYTVEEADAKGLTPFVKVDDGDETKTSTATVTLTMTDKEATVEFTNKNVIPEENPNIIEVKATKIWVNGPSIDHKAIDLKLYRQVDGGAKEEVTDAKLDKSADANDTSKFNYVWKNLPKINDDGNEYTYTVEEANVTDGKVQVSDNTYTVTQDGNTITNTYQVPKGNIKAEKVWEGLKEGENPPTTYFKLYRKLDDCKECQPVESAKIKELPAGTTEVAWEDQDLTDENGNKYIYSVKEVDKDGKEATPDGFVKVEDGLKVTNTKIAKDGKLTITKKLENEPKRLMTRAARSSSDPIAFEFRITKPDGTSETFELKAGESKSFEDLAYGKYLVKETKKHGYSPYFAIGDEEKQVEEFEVTISSSNEIKLTVTNKNIINPNDLTVRATKIWDGGPDSDHTAVTLQLLRTSAKAGSEEEDVSKDYKVEANKDETSDTITYVWKNLPKHDAEGYEYTYRVKELGVGDDKIYTVGNNKYVSKVEDDEENTSNETTSFKITNSYQVPKTEDIIANKVWKDLPEGTTKPIVKFQLYRKAKGSSVEEKVGESKELVNDQVNFGIEDKTDKNGVEYIYFVKELDENGAEFNKENYKTSYDGLTVTNTYQQEPTPDPDKPTPDPDKPTPDPDNPTPDPDNPTPDPDKPTPDPDNPTPDPDKPTPDPGTPGGDKPTPKPGDKPDPKPGEKPDPKPGETPEPKPGETPDPKPGEKPDPKPGEKPDPKPGETPDPKPGEKPDPKPGETPDPKPGEKPDPKPGEKPDPKPGETPEPKPGETPEPKPGDKPEPKPGETPEPKPGETPEPKPDDKPADKPEVSPPSHGKPGDKDIKDPEDEIKVVIPDKTGVKDKTHLTDEEKKEIIEKIKKVNPNVVEVIVDNNGNARLIYENEIEKTISSDKIVYEISKDTNKTSGGKTGMKGGFRNPRTGVTALGGVLATLFASAAALFASRKKDD